MSSKKNIRKDMEKLDFFINELKKETTPEHPNLIPSKAFFKKISDLENHVNDVLSKYDAHRIPKRYRARLMRFENICKLQKELPQKILNQAESGLSESGMKKLKNFMEGNFSEEDKAFLDKMTKYDLTSSSGIYEATQEMEKNRQVNDIHYLSNTLFNATSLSFQSRNKRGKEALDNVIILKLDNLIEKQAKKLSKQGINVSYETSSELKRTMANELPEFALTLVRAGRYEEAKELLNTYTMITDSPKKAKALFEEFIKASQPYPEGRNEFLALIKKELFLGNTELSEDSRYIVQGHIYSDSEQENQYADYINRDDSSYIKLIDEAEKITRLFADLRLRDEYESNILPEIRMLKDIFIPTGS